MKIAKRIKGYLKGTPKRSNVHAFDEVLKARTDNEKFTVRVIRAGGVWRVL